MVPTTTSFAPSPRRPALAIIDLGCGTGILTVTLADGSRRVAGIGDLRLQFRSLEQIVADVSAAGLEVLNVWQDWARTPFTNTAAEPLMAFEARLPQMIAS